MAIYHLSAQILGRSPRRNPDGTTRRGSNAVAAAAYRAGARLKCERTGEVFDYMKRHGVAHAEIMVPDGSPAWLRDRRELWNQVEKLESRKDAQLAREFNMALPHELTNAQRLELVREFVWAQFVGRGMVADFALHDPNPDEGQNAKNYHAHVMLTLRKATPQGLHPVKTREWNSKDLLTSWRAEWALACNNALHRAGHKARIDHRTLEAQRQDALERGEQGLARVLNREPEIHVGPRARQILRNGRTTTSRARHVGPGRRLADGGSPQRRTRHYPAHDRGDRLSWLESIIAGNSERLRSDLVKLNRRLARFDRKYDYWERRLTFWTDGVIGGKEFRFNRWKAAQEEKQRQAEAARKAEHARKRAAQISEIRNLLNGLIMGMTSSREQQLRRRREVSTWGRLFSGKALARDHSRERLR